MTIGDQYGQLTTALRQLYSSGESAAIATLVIEHFTGIPRNSLHELRNELITDQRKQEMRQALDALLRHEPVQYVLHEAWFYELPFYINKHVLIPRPETEELVYETIDWIKSVGAIKNQRSILDIGTGSGCIPISLKFYQPQWQVTSIDISDKALQVAKQNAAAHECAIQFIQQDFLNESNWPSLDNYDIIISNPPYIPMAEKDTLDRNVSEWEPGTALFVPNDDALLFYRKIAAFANDHLKEDGQIFLECHQDFAEATRELFEKNGFTAQLKQDMNGNNRILIAGK